jgi:hypothetical protein
MNMKKLYRAVWGFISIITILALFPHCGRQVPSTEPTIHKEPGIIATTMPTPEQEIKLPDTLPAALPSEPEKKQEPQIASAPDVIKQQAEKKSLAQAKKAKRKKAVNISKKTKTHDSDNPNELDFDVENRTGKTLYVTCFDYQRRRDFGRWRWAKSPVYKVGDDQIVSIDIQTIFDEQDRENVFGYLGVFSDKKMAEDATYELTPDKYLLDLDQLIKLKNKKVILEVREYGFKGELFEYDFVDKEDVEKEVPELDFAIENNTGKPILVTCFAYEKKAKSSWVAALEEKDDMTVWHFAKTPVIKLVPNQITIIDVDSILTDYDRKYVRGYLAIFDVDEEAMARKTTFEFLPSSRKMHLGELLRLKNKKIVIEVEKYGMMPDYPDFIIKPISQIDFTKIYTDPSKGVQHRAKNTQELIIPE